VRLSGTGLFPGGQESLIAPKRELPSHVDPGEERDDDDD
jgi:hypothetical protein